MKKILILGAGLSASSMIKYLLDHSEENNWKIVVGDQKKEVAEQKIGNHPNGEAIHFDLCDVNLKKKLISEADVVISMLPARFHHLIAEECVEAGVDMVTASYVSDQVKKMNDAAIEKGILFLNEVGVDPGIDHMSAMQIIDRIRNGGGKLEAFESSTGGLVAPEYDNNPWNYKFTWNPRNVVLAGQGTSRFLFNGRYKYIPYNKLFERTEDVDILDYGEFEIYANRDSLKYRKIYQLDDIQTLFRGTIRRRGYSEAWNVLVQLGMTDDSYEVEIFDNMTYRDFTNCFLKYDPIAPVEQKLADYLNFDEDSVIMNKLKWLGIFDDEPIDMEKGTPAQILQKLLESKWKLDDNDKDMIIMQHKFTYEMDDTRKELKSTMVVTGKDKVHTAMSITVGIPVAIATKLLLQGKITAKGVHIPVVADIYEPILQELKEYGIEFIEEEMEITE